MFYGEKKQYYQGFFFKRICLLHTDSFVDYTEVHMQYACFVAYIKSSIHKWYP